ncbi:Gfo/Idh/MocA family protein [Candidatus Bipolaricaulota bacterium]
MMRLGIIGAGGWGKNLVRVFCQLLGDSCVNVVDPDEARREAVKLDHPGVTATELPAWSEIDAAVIAAPAPLHYSLASEALEAGLHVLVEKPLALESEHVRSLIEVAENRSRILMVDHLLEYHPAVIRLKALHDEGTLGVIRHMTSQRLNLGVIRSEENAWWSLAPHDVSIVLHLMGESPIEVCAFGGTYLKDGIPDVVHATLRFESGAIAHIHVSWLEPVKTRRMTVVGSKAMAVFDDMSDRRLVLHAHKIQEHGGRYDIDRSPPAVQEIADTEPLRSMAEAFTEAVRTGLPPRSDGWDGLRVVRVLEAVQQSMDCGGDIIRVEANHG